MIRPAERSDLTAIRELYHRTGRPRRPVLRAGEYFVAFEREKLVGCAAVRPVDDGGYLYGLAVDTAYRRLGIGSALTRARLDTVRDNGGPAVALAMFWNVGFFRRLGFVPMRRDSLPWVWRRVSDLRNPVYKRSAVMWHDFGNA